jgi:hypothetical protein
VGSSSTEKSKLWRRPPGWPDWANFCPLGNYFIWATFAEVQKYVHSTKFWDTFFRGCESILTKTNCLGDFFINSFGHPVAHRLSRTSCFKQLKCCTVGAAFDKINEKIKIPGSIPSPCNPWKKCCIICGHKCGHLCMLRSKWQ